MASSNYSIAAPPVFNGNNYPMWAVKMKAYLKAFDLWEVVEVGGDPPTRQANPTIAQIKQYNEEVAKRFKALSCIHSAVTDAIFVRIMACESAKEAWDKIKEEFHGSDRTRQIQILNLLREFEVLKMKDEETMKDYSDKVLRVVNQLRLFGENITERRVVNKFLVSLPEKFESKISSLEDSKDLTTMSVSELINVLQAQEQRRALRQEDHVEAALAARRVDKRTSSGSHKKSEYEKKDKDKRYEEKKQGKKGQFPPCSYCKKKNHIERYCWYRPHVKCRACNQKGHVEKVCKNKENRVEEKVAIVEQKEDAEETLFMVIESNDSKKDSIWLIDSACSTHITGKIKNFLDLNKAYKSTVEIGDGNLLKIEGRGTIGITTKKGIKTIANVCFAPEVTQNLLSVGQLVKEKNSLLFKDELCTIFDPSGREIATVKMRNKCFPLDLNEAGHMAYKCVSNEARLWHRRLGHINYQFIKNMGSLNLVNDMPVITEVEKTCEVCLQGKQSRHPFPKQSQTRATNRLQLIHTDICGPIGTLSLNGNKYFILFIDDFSRFCWIFFLKQKSEAIQYFMKFKVLVEKQTDQKIKALRSDNGSEYTSNEFKALLTQEGIKQFLTVTYSPQQNGVSERKNRTIMEMIRCLLFEQQMPKYFWAEAANFAVTLQNLIPTTALNSMTPFEVWHGYKPSISNVKVFGCIAYAQVPQQKRTKLDSKTQISINLGYSSVSKGYRLFNVKTKKVFISRDVVFNEDIHWNWMKNEIAENKNDNVAVNLDVFEEEAGHELDDNIDDIPVRGIRSLQDIYEQCNVAITDPCSYIEAASDEQWKLAMEAEMTMIKRNQTWILVDRPKHQRVISVKWIFRTKLNSDGSINKLKARLVVRGFSQVHGVDFFETFAPVARHDTIRLLVALAGREKWRIWHMDVKSAFLNGTISEDIYVEQPEGFVEKGKEDKVCKLIKALYGLKQAPRAWYKKIDAYLRSNKFFCSESEPTLYVKSSLGKIQLFVSVYVDDLLITGPNKSDLNSFRNKMKSEFDMSDLGEMSYFLGLAIQQRKLIGCLLYLSASRPDIMYTTSLLSRFMQSPTKTHLTAAKRVLRYVKGTLNYGLLNGQVENKELEGYSDSDWAGSYDDSKSTSGYCFSFGSAMFSWNSKKQDIVAQSSAEAEYVAAASATNQALWLRKVLLDLKFEQINPTVLWLDNQSAIALAKNPINHSRTKHIRIKFHVIREVVTNNEVVVNYYGTDDQIVDIFTKGLCREKFELLRSKLGMGNVDFKEV
ncbi:Uncharacterized protein TCM_040529 [Theobroma cacao]|uniref:Integrase catalytic domain-containing protein n=1 Tax=Theobroma cacao TaxID=3641 RepID=A0A061GT04_THECC|nr:Uncharacterized protein TCM_040529 [Theobroma cacao]